MEKEKFEIELPKNLNPKTKLLVIGFIESLSKKLREAEKKYGYSYNWEPGNWREECIMQLHEHLYKGDPRGVAAYCMFCWYHNWPTVIK